MLSPVVVSAPGKILLAGGYVVLDRAYTGLVYGLDARINVLVAEDQVDRSEETEKTAETHVTEAVNALKADRRIVVTSPQFREAVWRYQWQASEEKDGGVLVTQDPADSTSNQFVETTLQYVLSYLHQQHPLPTASIRVSILADNDYYTTLDEAQEGTPPTRFRDFGTTLRGAHKTGLGSSAALVTSLTGALLTYYRSISLSTEGTVSAPSNDVTASSKRISTSSASVLLAARPDDRTILHNLAQVAHCTAQGKAGSGFDVAAAVYGSCVYRRFSPDLLNIPVIVGRAGFGQYLVDLIHAPNIYQTKDTATANVAATSFSQSALAWDVEIRPNEAVLPHDMELRMLDVDCGSETVGMVKKVLQWRAENQTVAKPLFDRIHELNTNLAEQLLALSKTPGSEAVDNDNHSSVADSSKATLSKRKELVREAILAIREKTRELSRLAQVPIEPPSQTRLLDALTEQVGGLYGGVVPGAGGYDAVGVLVEKGVAHDGLLAFVQRWNEEKAGREASSSTEADEPKLGRVRVLRVRGELEGAREESIDLFRGWC